MEGLPKAVQRRIKALKNNQVEIVKVDAEFHREVCALQASFEKRYQEVYDKVRGRGGGEGKGREGEGKGGGRGGDGRRRKGRGWEKKMYICTLSSIRLVGGDGRGEMRDSKGRMGGACEPWR